MSANLNACLLLANIPVDVYLSKVSNLAFRDLTLNQCIPKAATEVLGLLRPQIHPHTFLLNNQKQSHFISKRSDQKRNAQSLFVSKEDENAEIPKLQLKSLWWPPTISKEVLESGLLFEKEVAKLFSRKQKNVSNLSPFLCPTLLNLQKDDQFLHSGWQGVGNLCNGVPQVH